MSQMVCKFALPHIYSVLGFYIFVTYLRGENLCISIFSPLSIKSYKHSSFIKYEATAVGKKKKKKKKEWVSQSLTRKCEEWLRQTVWYVLLIIKSNIDLTWISVAFIRTIADSSSSFLSAPEGADFKGLLILWTHCPAQASIEWFISSTKR